MLEAAGVDSVVTVDLHSSEIRGYFTNTTTVNNLTAQGVGAAYIGEKEVCPRIPTVFFALVHCIILPWLYAHTDPMQSRS